MVLRNYERLPDHVQNDIDVLIPPVQLELAEKTMIAAAQEAGYILQNRAEFTPLCFNFHDPRSLLQIQVDLFTNLGYRIFEIIPAQRAVERRVERPLFAIPDPVDEAIINLLTRLLYNDYIKEAYQPGIREVFCATPDKARDRLATSFGPHHAAFLVESVQAQQWSAIESHAPELRRALLAGELKRRPVGILVSALKDIWRLLRRAIRPPGLSIAILGPDGCGKSTVIPRIANGLQHTFLPGKGLQLHWKPTVFFKSRRKSGLAVTDPHARPPRTLLLSIVYLLFHWMEYVLGSLSQIFPVKFNNGLVITDRYYYDFLVDPRRYRLNLPPLVLRLGAVFVPKPDLVFLLDAPIDVLRSRKQEVSAAETERQRNAFRSLVNSLDNGRVVDANHSPSEVADSIVRIILEHLASRTAARHRSG